MSPLRILRCDRSCVKSLPDSSARAATAGPAGQSLDYKAIHGVTGLICRLLECGLEVDRQPNGHPGLEVLGAKRLLGNLGAKNESGLALSEHNLDPAAGGSTVR